MRSAHLRIQVCGMMPDHVETVFWSMCTRRWALGLTATSQIAMSLVDSLYLVSLLLPLVAHNSALSAMSVIIYAQHGDVNMTVQILERVSLYLLSTPP